jgi:hypothetical protein
VDRAVLAVAAVEVITTLAPAAQILVVAAAVFIATALGLADLESLLFDMQIPLLPLLQLQALQPLLYLAGIVFISGLAPAQLLGDVWLTLHNLMKTTSLYELLL